MGHYDDRLLLFEVGTEFGCGLYHFKSEVCRVKTQLYYLTYELLVPATVSSHNQADSKNIQKDKQYTCNISQRSWSEIQIL